MRVAGIDPGTIKAGIGIVEQDSRGVHTIAHVETISVSEKLVLAERLRLIYIGLREILTTHRPDIVVIESAFFSKDVKSAVKIGEARGVAMLAALELAIPVTEYPPARIKQAICGNGRAEKSQVQFMVKQIFRLKEVLPPDSADAIAIAVCHLHHCRWTIKKPTLTVKV